MIIRSASRRARIEAAPVAAVEQFERGKARLVVHFRMACDPESEVYEREAALARQFDLAQDRAGAESARRCGRIEKSVYRRQSSRGEVSHGDGQQAFAQAQFD